MTATPLQLPCLGRPFQLGMLYDCNRDHLISEVTLWDTETLKRHQSCTTKVTSSHEVLDNNTLNEKYNYLEISGDYRLSCLVGLVKFSGSAVFLKEDVSSLQQVRVCFKYCSNTKYEEININKLKDIPCTQSIPATHVVTAISYGADAIFVFDYTWQKHEDKQEIVKLMKNMVENLPYMCIDTKGHIKCNLDIINEAQINRIRCKVYTDIHLESSPTTFRDAIKAYKLLLEKSNDTKNIVPKKFWLYPLKDLKTKGVNEYAEISASSLNAVQSIIENLKILELKTNDLKTDDTTVTFVVFQKELNRFATCISQYKLALFNEVRALLPVIRSGKQYESDLKNLLKTYNNSVFSTTELDKWLEGKKREITAIKNYLQQVHEVEHAFLQEKLDEAVDCLEYTYIICFEFNICGKDDAYLKLLYDFSQSRDLGSNPVKCVQPWYKNNTIKAKIRAELKRFNTFFEANKNKSDVKYLLTLPNSATMKIL